MCPYHISDFFFRLWCPRDLDYINLLPCRELDTFVMFNNHNMSKYWWANWVIYTSVHFRQYIRKFKEYLNIGIYFLCHNVGSCYYTVTYMSTIKLYTLYKYVLYINYVSVRNYSVVSPCIYVKVAYIYFLYFPNFAIWKCSRFLKMNYTIIYSVLCTI